MDIFWSIPQPVFVKKEAQRRRRRQREWQKSRWFRFAKQQLCTCITLSFKSVHFLAVVARPQRESAYFLVLARTGTQDNNFPFLFLNFDTVL